ncbi:hypothetical protein E3Q23_02504 [Wallemia mellicola]|uniref:Uncharacterized protein n=1 Tax=Wallemia mellicola TaxID=1708541 RepID=A0A4T0LXU0_9BASI|nr:hypothetical protein E3Q23_02504 [Wallemia mellicola]TIB99446.1 hypothetical protein E3Q17_02597 [Wallemia mellicola]TIC27200.1 hypothetical protein E3Q11_02599 [Wallemia mellicola]TIC74188.1 hypothetical protein E3Q00_02146 [Wallemia mellicola]
MDASYKPRKKSIKRLNYNLLSLLAFYFFRDYLDFIQIDYIRLIFKWLPLLFIFNSIQSLIVLFSKDSKPTPQQTRNQIFETSTPKTRKKTRVDSVDIPLSENFTSSTPTKQISTPKQQSPKISTNTPQYAYLQKYPNVQI